MKYVLLIVIAVSISFPVGILMNAVPCLHGEDQLPHPAALEDCSDSMELVKSGDFLCCPGNPEIAVTGPLTCCQTQTSPCSIAPPADTESHFCRPPPR